MLWGKTRTSKLPPGSRCDVPEPGESNRGESLNKQQGGRLLEKRYVYFLCLCKSSRSFQQPGYHLSVLGEHWLKTVLVGVFLIRFLFFWVFFLLLFLLCSSPEGCKMNSPIWKVPLQKYLCKVPNSLQNCVSNFLHPMSCICLQDFWKLGMSQASGPSMGGGTMHHCSITLQDHGSLKLHLIPPSYNHLETQATNEQNEEALHRVIHSM